MRTITIDDIDNTFLTSDTHFDHYHICGFCNRPFSSNEDHNAGLIEQWNKKVPKDGVVIHNGDFTLTKREYRYKKFREKLNGSIHLVRGNHDIIQITPDANIFDSVSDMLVLLTDYGSILCSHFPISIFPQTYNAYGHVHTLWDGKIHGRDSIFEKYLNPLRQYDVGVDQNGYAPISVREFLGKFKQIN